MMCYYCNWQLNIRGYDGIGRHARFRFSCFTACRFDPCYPHQKGTCFLASASACQKSLWLFCTLQKRHIFCENRFSRKISLRSSKSLINQAFLMAINPISSGAFAPSSSPAALLSFFCSIVFRQPVTKAPPLGRAFVHFSVKQRLSAARCCWHYHTWGIKYKC